MINKFPTLQEAAKQLLQMLINSTKRGTLPIAGLIIDSNGQIIHKGVNSVIEIVDQSFKRCVRNPTGHGQQTILTWYWSNKAKLNLPQPSQLTLITTLDPCMMCASSIVMSGFNVGTISLDVEGGVNYHMNRFADFEFSENYQKALVQRFGYYSVKGIQHREEYKYEAQKVYFREQSLSKQLEKQIQLQFTRSIYLGQTYRSLIPRQKLKNLKQLPQDQRFLLSLKNSFPNVLSISLTERVTVNGVETYYYQPNLQLKIYLQTLVKNTPLAQNAVALIDTFGNLLFACADRFDLSPIKTAIINVVVQYSQYYFTQILHSHKNKIIFQQQKSYHYLPPIQYCTFIYLNALPGNEAASLQAVGVYAFTHNRLTPQGGFMYINDYEDKSKATLEEAIQHLAPLYKKGVYYVRPKLAKIGKNE